MEIKKITLYTNQIEKQKQFYHHNLGFTLIRENEELIELQIGKSILAFQYKQDCSPYHFAMNIPSFQEQEALAWLQKKTKILNDENENNIQDFDDWNAKAIYFYDPDNNIVEFIARKNLAYQTDRKFTAQSVKEISEIGIPTDKIAKHYDWLHQQFSLEIYSGTMHRFCAIGNEKGLFICIDKNIKKWFPTNDDAHSSPFEITIKENEKIDRIAYSNDKLKLLSYF